MNLQEKAENQEFPPMGLYCHVPFCATTCDFCSFYQKEPRRADLERYLVGMELEFEQRSRDIAGARTVFWGGGTPGLLPAGDLQRLGRALLHHLKRAPMEWTVEMAPSTVKVDKLLVMADMGVTRLSSGVQSFSAATLERLGRQHGPKLVYQAYDRMRNQGSFSINLDLMFAIPGQTLGEWEADLLEAIRLQPEHISTYCLTFEEDTALWAKLQKGLVHRRTEEEEARFYTLTWEILAAHGYQQYEISNFAKPGHACQHNLHTWAMGQWIGCGPSASSQHNGWRRTHPHSLEDWLKGLASGDMPYFDSVPLDDALLAVDAVIFGLRCNRGVNLEILQRRFPAVNYPALDNTLSSLKEEGLVEFAGSVRRLTADGRLLADSIGAELIEARALHPSQPATGTIPES